MLTASIYELKVRNQKSVWIKIDI